MRVTTLHPQLQVQLSYRHHHRHGAVARGCRSRGVTSHDTEPHQNAIISFLHTHGNTNPQPTSRVITRVASNHTIAHSHAVSHQQRLSLQSTSATLGSSSMSSFESWPSCEAGSYEVTVHWVARHSHR